MLSRHFILTPVGSAGDVLPYIGIGTELRRRGHEVTLIGPGLFGERARRADIVFVESPTTEQFEQVTHDPDLWHPTRGLRLVLRMASQSMRELYGHIAAVDAPGKRTVLVGHGLSFATRVYEEKHGTPAVTLQLAPAGLRSTIRPPAVIPGRDSARLPLLIKAAAWWLVDRFMIDRHIEPMLNQWRRELGMSPVHRTFAGWINSPGGVVCMFPGWFCPPAPDWPTPLVQAGFSLYDGADQEELGAEVTAFLGAGSPPIAFTPGSANRQAPRFFEAAIDASARLGRRALLLTRYPEQLPGHLPPHALHVPYAPFSRLLPHCAAAVHHGGIGTSSQALAAGIPQICMILGFDQPDNATHLHRLGVGTWLKPKQFTGLNLAARLKPLLDSSAVAVACRRCAGLVSQTNGIAAACNAIESFTDR